MAKSKPIGVRFDEVVFERLQTERNIKTKQQALTFLEGFYEESMKRKDLISEAQKDFEKKEILRKVNPPITEEYKEKIKADVKIIVEGQIKAIQAEKIPEHRNTPLGRKAWTIEQQNRINELKTSLE